MAAIDAYHYEFSKVYFHKESPGISACIDTEEDSHCATGGTKQAALDELQRSLRDKGYAVKLEYR